MCFPPHPSGSGEIDDLRVRHVGRVECRGLRGWDCRAQFSTLHTWSWLVHGDLPYVVNKLKGDTHLTRDPSLDRRYRAVLRNERLTALAGAVLLVGFAVDLFVTANLSRLIMVHIFIGALLAGPLIVKLTGVGYRFFKYYGKSPAFVAKGPPNIWLRLLGPALLVVTLALFISGFGLAFEGPVHDRVLFFIHAASAAMWIPMIAVHVYGHIRQVPRSILEDWGSQSRQAVSGRVKRLRFIIMGLIVGTVAGVVMVHVAAPWRAVRLPAVIPSPLVLGVVAAVIGVLIAIPLLREATE